jgi:D-methionine transport system substrate-binding protein
MKKFVALLLAALLVLSAASAFADKITIAVPNDATNEGRALMLLQDYGVLKLKDGTGIKATKDDIEAFLTVDEI